MGSALDKEDNINQDKHDESKKIVVIGGMHYITILTSKGTLVLQQINPVEGERKFTGNAYNLADVMRQLNDNVQLMVVISDDSVHHLLIKNAQQHNIPVIAIPIPGYPTASCTALHGSEGEMLVAGIVRDLYDQLDVKKLEQYIKNIKSSAAIVTDSIFTEEVYAYLSMIAAQYGLDVYVIISSLETAKNIKPLLDKSKCVFGDVASVSQLAENYDFSDAGIRDSLKIIAAKGAEAVFATSKNGVYALVKTAKGQQEIQVGAREATKAISTHGTDNGTYEAFAATVIHCMRKGIPAKEAIDLGLLAAEIRKNDKGITMRDLMTLQMQQSTERKTKQQVIQQLPSLVPVH